MARRIAVLLQLALLAALSLAGCGGVPGGGGNYPYSYSPYDSLNNPNCGALGSCPAASYPRVGPHDGSVGF